MNGFYEQNLSYLQSNDVTEMLGYDSRPFPSSCSSNNTDVALAEKGVKQLSSSPLYVNARGAYLNVCRTFRQEFLRLENFEETLFSNIMKGTVNETHLTTLQMQFEVCSRLFNQQREKKVVLVELISQNLQRKSSNDICGNNNYFMKELASEKAAGKLIGDKKRIEQAEDTIDYNVSLSSMTDKHSSVQHLKSISIRHSCGRTRQDLNRLRLGHGHGMFATFGNEQFCFRMKNGSIQISHLILDNCLLEPLQVWIRRGKTRLSLDCGRALSVTNNPIPVFYDPREDNNCIYYIGHYIPLPSTAKALSITSSKDFSMHVILEFVKFDDLLAKAMSTSLLNYEDDREACVKEEICFSKVKKETQLDQDRQPVNETNYRRNILRRSPRNKSSSRSIVDNNSVSSYEENTMLSPDFVNNCSSTLALLEKSPMHRSCGRTRQDLNKIRLGHSHGMFASFGNQEFCFRKKHGSVQISHLILNSNSVFRLKTLKFWIQKGKTRLNLNCGRALSKMSNPIPVFYDPRESDMCIYYVGHWRPLASTTKDLSASSRKECPMHITLQFNNFDSSLAQTMQRIMMRHEDERKLVIKKESFSPIVKEEDQLEHDQSLHSGTCQNHEMRCRSNKSSTSSRFNMDIDPFHSSEEAFYNTNAFLHKSNIRRSNGRTREDLNKLRLGYCHGMFSSFSNQDFCFRKKHGCIQISHLILKSFTCNSETMKFFVRRGKTRLFLSCGRALSRMNSPIPVFVDPREDDACIYYVGHWMPLPWSAKELPISDNMEFSMHITLQYIKFDDFLATAMSYNILGAGNKRKALVKQEDIFLEFHEEENINISLSYRGHRNSVRYPALCNTRKSDVGKRHQPLGFREGKNRKSKLGSNLRSGNFHAIKAVSSLSSDHIIMSGVKLEDYGEQVHDFPPTLKRRRVS